MEKELVDQILTAINENGSYAISQYVKWFVISSLCWITAGLFLIAGAIKIKVSDDIDEELILFARIFFAVIGCLMLAFNIPDLVSPTGAAIHQLITDITG